MTPAAKLAAVAALTLATAPPAWGAAEGPGTPQAIAAHAEFLATWPAPPSGAAAVCVIDSGVDTDTDLGRALVARSAFDGGTLGDTGALGDQGTPHPKHGTYVAGVIASQIDGVGTNGIWPAAKVISNRVFAGPEGGTTAQRYIRAIDWCVNQTQAEVKVINLSISGLTATLEEKAALENRIINARSIEGLNVVAAAGNSGLSVVGYPAVAPGVFAVGATDLSGAFWSDSGGASNRGAGLDISTFGGGTCLTLGYGSGLGLGKGTSYAAPVVSAVVAALRSARPDVTPDEAEQLLLDSADTKAAGKVLNAAKAFQAAGLLTAAQIAESHPANACEPPPATAGGGGLTGGIGGGGLAGTTTPGAKDPGVAPSADELTVPARVAEVALRDDPSAALRPARPTLRSLRYTNGVLTVSVAGRRRGQRAIFRIDRSVNSRQGATTRTTRYVRSRPTLHVRVKGWTRIRVQLEVPGVGTSPALIIRRSLKL